MTEALTPASPDPDLSPATLRQQLVRKLDEVVLTRQYRPPLYDTRCGSLTDAAPAGSPARKLGAGLDILAPGQRGCP